MRVIISAKSSKATLLIKDKKVSLPLNYVQYVFGGKEMKPVPSIKK